MRWGSLRSWTTHLSHRVVKTLPRPTSAFALVISGTGNVLDSTMEIDFRTALPPQTKYEDKRLALPGVNARKLMILYPTHSAYIVLWMSH
ncbi:uncharacterized protein K444DRAFT_134599 [Hyaloscypha bicolor E]|uniref:Uncharacterized protein n=1 Tax=Hyaloscypha bicolor E TaxID=1095630 RepID=A0A2J6STD7_9HELO|nr:uncharacterized protein K444DRAFT_134599 [Hyaloscypha bicolor E]PMD54048.1 hypothetical protein K444DRAFT_134599 [Hyaloscypha bicolor E]